MFCPGCGNELKSDWQFCAHCGRVTNLPEARAECNSRSIAVDKDGDKELSEALTVLEIGSSSRYEQHTEAMGAIDDAEIPAITYKPSSDWENSFDFGSDSADDDALVSEEDMAKFEKILENSGFNTLMQKINEDINQWKTVSINIAITGESGTGKSTLINALRNMKADDEGAAEIGCTETTIEPTSYSYKDNENVKIWDLPGVGTPNFPRETYLEKIKIARFDFILLVSSSRYKDNDTWLANQIKLRSPNSTLFFIRTKVDQDLDGYEQGQRRSLLPGFRTNLIRKIKSDSKKNLTEARISEVKLFLINSHRTDTFDFKRLTKMLIEKVAALKRDAIILSLSVVLNDIADEKIRVLESRIKNVSLCGALEAINSDRNSGQRLELNVIMAEVLFYISQLGIDGHSVSLIAKTLKKQEEDIYRTLQMQSRAIMKTHAAFAQFYDQFDKFRPSAFHRLPFFGKRSKVRHYQHQCAMVLKRLLTICSSETQRLQTTLVVWLNE